MSAVRSSLLLSAANSYIGLVLQVASTVVIARILTPSEAGVFAVASVFAALGSTFRDFGVAEYLVQKKEVNEDDLRACFALNLAVSWAVAVLLLLGSSVTSAFYRDPGVGTVMQVQALNFILIPFGAITLAWFRREMKFGPIFRASIAANLLQFFTSVGLALAGFSYMALAWGSLVGVAATVAVAMWSRPSWFPRWPSFKGIREVFHFGKFASGVFLAGQLAKGAPELVIGRTAGMADVGMYSRATGVVELFERLVGQAVAPVCLPYLAQGARRDGSVVPSLAKATTLVTGIGWPFVIFLALAAFPTIRLMYGAQWVAAVPVARIICGVVAIDIIFRFGNQALFSQGLVKDANGLQIRQLGLRLAGLSLAVPFGLAGAAWGLLMASALGLLVSQSVLSRAISYRARDIWQACLPSLVLAVVASAPYALILVFWAPGESNFVAHGVVGVLVTAVSWLAAVKLLAHPLWPELVRVANSAMAKFKRREGGAPP